ncbi:division/cell wall cluster transcriptional repressor MraZ [Spiroplasma sp. BIUS-1]|uniref:division/cell wall cluster transcriptional repressor MraZ n=1 Tax=Spiroplasma sp. BIUS-1 TaxID=216964 RepID=UPI00139896A5|nr:division/cell wall cluster transcriptional repressor MraZ [Spiroplasma sp. BIUS-1]QHX36866.1 cell division protein MraZ [Spiroplasma sp. BIUS-1]
MLFGKFEHNLDDKSRLTIPSKLRNKLGELVYVTRSIDGNCLEIRTPENFEKWYSELKSQSALSTSTRTVVRTIFSNTDEVSIDNAGRVKLPSNLLEEVGISKTVQITGAGEWIEIWDKDKHLTYDKQAKSQLVDAAEKLGGVN